MYVCMYVCMYVIVLEVKARQCPLKSNFVENGAKIGEGPSTALLAAVREGFATLSGNITNAISEALKSVKADLADP